MIPSKHSFSLLSNKDVKKIRLNFKLSKKKAVIYHLHKEIAVIENEEAIRKRTFLRLAGLVGLGVATVSFIPKKASALVFGSTPASNVVGLKDISNAPINPATEDTLVSITTGLKILKTSIEKTASGTVLSAGAQKIRIYNLKFSLSADQTSVAFNFGVNGAFEKYLAAKTGGLYGANNQPNYVEGAVGEDLKVAFADAGTVQVNVDYLLV